MGEAGPDVLKRGRTYVKSPVASLTLTCSSVKKRVRVTMLVLIVSASLPPLVCTCADIVKDSKETRRTEQDTRHYQADCLRAEQNGAVELVAGW